VTKWQTDIQTGLRLGVLFIAGILLVDGGLIAWIATQPVSIRTFMVGLVSLASVALIGLLAYWLNGLLRSGYTLDRNALTITWGANEQTVPTPQIERVVLGEELESRAFRFRGVSWPGHWVGYGEVQDLGSALFYATVPPKKQVYLVTPAVVYGVSPEDRAGFLHALQIRMQMGPTQAVEQASRGPAFLTWDFWRDRLGLGLLTGALALVLALTGFICARFAALPRLLPLHFDAAGAPDRLGPQGQIFFLPLIGLVTWIVNGVLGGFFYRRERLASYLLWGGAAVVQALFWVAVLGILKAA
jgi:hypothetical protein